MAYQKHSDQYINWSQPFLKVARLALLFRFMRKFLLDYSEKKLYQVMVEDNHEIRPRAKD